jgi:hypothetical protein
MVSDLLKVLDLECLMFFDFSKNIGVKNEFKYFRKFNFKKYDFG